MKRGAIVAAMVAALVVPPLVVLPLAAGASNASVSIKGRQYRPSSLSIKAGTVVTWSNDENDLPFTKTQHTVTADDGSFNSDVISPGETFTLSFPKAGSWPYHCNIHPNMHGIVTVTGARASSTPSATASTRPSTSSSAKPRKSASPSASPDTSASPGASDGQALGGSSSTSSSAGAIISIAIVAIAVLVGAGYFVYVRFVRAPD